MKKSILILLALLSMQVFAADKLYVKSLEAYESIKPEDTFRVELLQDGELGDIQLLKGNVINCTLDEVKAPSRLKRDAKIYFNIANYENETGVHNLETPMVAKFAKRVLNMREIKKTSPKKVIKTTASTVGSIFVTGFSQAVSFVDGAVENKEDNRMKSGFKQVYDDSLFSFVEYGEDVVIEKDDIFYFVAKKKKD